MVVLPPLVDKTRVADLPAILKVLNRWSRLETSSSIFATDSEEMEAIVRSSQYTLLSINWKDTEVFVDLGVFFGCYFWKRVKFEFPTDSSE